jgi:hypothetical protein
MQLRVFGVKRAFAPGDLDLTYLRRVLSFVQILKQIYTNSNLLFLFLKKKECGQIFENLRKESREKKK